MQTRSLTLAGSDRSPDRKGGVAPEQQEIAWPGPLAAGPAARRPGV